MSRASLARRHVPSAPVLPRATLLPREPRRHDAHYFDLAAAIAAMDECADEYARFRQDESAGRLDPPF